ncbi:Ectopic P granules protein 4 [Caenorhabditis elegans]|uniref:Ectopic P granules protein 4 n=1 Tax=Caenorhabditis elegans TaxID=6239 RepID=EI24_CAEEL|nr:Ectopic P granules protein 4 [Caenorhabditis elegans]Q20123.1 RecName: Full=Ectopic P granules protein 4 [Caenorhabditis elegans]CCD70735.1 Ectopic P granules protein 4 [Caenorhabditis elegans]|eukprot:NP_498575.1 Ectopic P granules protein 4 [Caenorhabditis elegans]
MVKFQIIARDFYHGFIDSFKGITFVRRIREEEAKEVKVEPPKPVERTVLMMRREKQGIFKRPPEPPKKKDSFLKKLWQIYAMNIGFLVLWQVCILILGLFFSFFDRTDLGHNIGYILIIPIFFASRIIQALWFSDISGACMRALKLPPPPVVPFSSMLAGTLISALHQIFFLIQGMLSQYLPIPLITPVIVYLHMALLNSMYCFDYFFDGYNLSFLRRKDIFESHWPYFLGFGTPLALACSISSNMFVNSVIFALLFPFFIITSYPANWNRKYEEEIPKIAFCRISYMFTELVGKFVKSITPTNNPTAARNNAQN